MTKQLVYDFSIVMACYNVENYVEQSINSVIKQRYPLSKIQIIAVDDGSVDNTLQILNKLHNKYPDNIMVLSQQNAGPSGARNLGLQHAKGKYINFLDSDDLLSKTALRSVRKFFAKHSDVDLVTLPIYKFDATKGEHHLNDKFSKGNRVIDLTKEPTALLKHVNASFYKRESLQQIQFDTNINIGEDVKFNNQVLADKMKYGVCVDAKYWYRIRQGTSEGSLLQSSLKNKKYFINTVDNLFYWAVEFCQGKFGNIPQYYQYVLANELYWRINRHIDQPLCLSDDEWQVYKRKIAGLCKYLDDDIVVSYSALTITAKQYIFSNKYNTQPQLSVVTGDIELKYGECTLSKISQQSVWIEFLQIDNNRLHIEGKITFLGEIMPDNIIVDVNDKQYVAKFINRQTYKDSVLDCQVCNNVGFEADIDIADKHNSIRMQCTFDNTVAEFEQLQFGKFSPIGTEYKNSYYYKDRWLFSTVGNSIIVRRKGRLAVAVREVKMLLEAFFKGDKKGFVCRLYYHLFKRRLSKKQYWLLSDRAVKADDNGEVFFEYIRQHHRKQIKCKFVISKHCQDYQRIKKIGKTIEYASLKYKLQYLLCDMVVSSNADDIMSFPARGIKALRDILADKKFVFLQHGVIKDDLSDWLHKYSRNLYKFVTSTLAEYQSILQYSYHYDEKVVILTGLPRFDKLYNNTQKQIVIMPTWRKYLMTANINGVWSSSSLFETSDYYKFYNGLINDQRLISVAKQYGYTLAFLPHPNTYLAYIDKFVCNADVKILNTESRYRDVFAQSDLLVTDYSSVAFDFAYLKKPIVYCQFDKDTFFNGGHAYTKGYFDYEKDGFGEVCYDLDSTVNTIIEYIKNNCEIKPQYLERIENTFKYTDKDNCQRVYNAIVNK